MTFGMIISIILVFTIAVWLCYVVYKVWRDVKNGKFCSCNCSSCECKCTRNRS